MNKKLQVFVSSTYTDLIEERQAAVAAILDAGHIPAGMELFKAGKSQMKTIRKWIDESDVYMLILGGRYGSIEEDSGLSYTELEYRYALSKNIPVFSIILDDSFLFIKAASKGKDVIFENENINKYESFKKYVKTKVVKFISNTDQISSQIHSQLNDILDDPDYNLIGWIRNNNENECLQLQQNINELEQKNNALESQLKKLQLESGNNFGNYTFLETYKNLKNKYFIIRHKQYSALDCFINFYSKSQELGDTVFSYLQSYGLVENELYSGDSVKSRVWTYREAAKKGISLQSKNRISKAGEIFYSMLEKYEYINH